MSRLRGTFRPRVTLVDLLLVITAVATAMAYHRTHQQLGEVRFSLASLRPLARELRIEDPAKIAAVTRMPTSPGEMILDVYVPPQRRTQKPQRLALSLEGVAEHGADAPFPTPVQTHPIASGRREVEIRHIEPQSHGNPTGEHQIDILLDGEVVISARRPPNWIPAGGWTSTGTLTDSRTFAPDRPAELHRRRFNQPVGTGPSNTAMATTDPGILLWIEE